MSFQVIGSWTGESGGTVVCEPDEGLWTLLRCTHAPIVITRVVTSADIKPRLLDRRPLLRHDIRSSRRLRAVCGASCVPRPCRRADWKSCQQNKDLLLLSKSEWSCFVWLFVSGVAFLTYEFGRSRSTPRRAAMRYSVFR